MTLHSPHFATQLKPILTIRDINKKYQKEKLHLTSNTAPLQGCVESSGSNASEEALKRTTHILNITTDYIVLAESAHKGVRLLEPHGARYLGTLITFNLELDKDNTIRVS